ncbi:MAG: hypothetical protein ACRCZO_12350, partial [Cetobacterium sp.]
HTHTHRERERERETHFLLHCQKYTPIRDLYFTKFSDVIKNFTAMSEVEQIKLILGERPTAALTARYERQTDTDIHTYH